MATRMFIRSLVFVLAFCLVAQPAVYAQEQTPATASTSQAATAAQADQSAAIKTELQHIGKGNPAIVVFSDGATHAGRIKKLGTETFGLDEGFNQSGSYSYSEVSSVSMPQGSTMGAKVMPIAFLTTGLIVVAGVVGFAVVKSSSGASGSATSAIPAK